MLMNETACTLRDAPSLHFGELSPPPVLTTSNDSCFASPNHFMTHAAAVDAEYPSSTMHHLPKIPSIHAFPPLTSHRKQSSSKSVNSEEVYCKEDQQQQTWPSDRSSDDNSSMRKLSTRRPDLSLKLQPIRHSTTAPSLDLAKSSERHSAILSDGSALEEDEEEQRLIMEENAHNVKLTARAAAASLSSKDAIPVKFNDEMSTDDDDDDSEEEVDAAHVQRSKSATLPPLMSASPRINVDPVDSEIQRAEPMSAHPIMTSALRNTSFNRDSKTLLLRPKAFRANSDADCIKVYAGTWNMHGKPAPSDNDMTMWLPGGEFDVYAVGTEECDEISIERATLMAPITTGRKERWCKRLLSLIGESEYALVEEVGMVAMHLAIFVRRCLLKQITCVSRGRVATGIGDFIGNKGGVAVSFRLRATSFLFVNSHFAAHHHATDRRNDDFAKINSKLCTRLSQSNAKTRSQQTMVASESYDRVFWLGDLNYRIDGSYTIVTHLIRSRMHEVLLNNDQLLKERLHSRVFQGFYEAPITFNPTYKVNAGSKDGIVVYDTSKKRRVPGFTDRILWRDQSQGEHIQCISYRSIESITTSDHFPVRADFNVQIDSTNANGNTGASPNAAEPPKFLIPISYAKWDALTLPIYSHKSGHEDASWQQSNIAEVREDIKEECKEADLPQLIAPAAEGGVDDANASGCSVQ